MAIDFCLSLPASLAGTDDQCTLGPSGVPQRQASFAPYRWAWRHVMRTAVGVLASTGVSAARSSSSSNSGGILDPRGEAQMVFKTMAAQLVDGHQFRLLPPAASHLTHPESGTMSSVASFIATSPLGVSASQWSSLSSGVGGRLRLGIPFSAPCFDKLEGVIPTANATACKIVKDTYVDEYPRISTFGSQTNTQWETCQLTGEQCLLDWTNPNNTVATSPPYKCEWGSVSPLYIEVQQPGDVIAAFKFSKKTKIPLAIRNTGHDYVGRASAPKSLGVSVKTLKKLEYSETFVADGCSSTTTNLAVTTGAGVTWAEAYAFADANGAMIVGGSDGSVGATGGYLQGGGHSPLSATLGLAADRALKIVTPRGEYLTANACQNTDLFWALRGGGGGTFGVVLEATHTVARAVPLQVTYVGWTGAPNATLTRELWSINVDHAARWADLGLSGFVFPQLMVYISPALGADEARAAMAPALAFGERLVAQGVEGAAAVQETRASFLSFFETYVAPYHANTGKPQPLASRLVPRGNFANDSSRTALKDALGGALELTGGGVWLLATTPAVYNTTAATDVSYHPAWREAVYEVVLWTVFNFNATLEEKRASYATTAQAIDLVRDLTPDAAYFNEADVHEPNWQETFWGGNYDRLLSIKNKYDPDHLLDCWHCVGWQEQSKRYACYI